MPDYGDVMWGENPIRLLIELTVAKYHIKGQGIAIINPETGDTEVYPVPEPNY